MKNPRFHQLLRARGMNMKMLASLVQCLPTHMSEVINSRPGRGGRTRRKLFPFIAPDEAAALGWSKQYELWQHEQSSQSSM